MWSLTNRVLAEQGLTTINAGSDSELSVVKLPNAAQVAPIERMPQARETKSKAGYRRILIPLQRASSKEVVAAIQLVLSKSAGSVSESDQAGFVVVADLTSNLDLALLLVDQLDGTQGGAIVKLIPAKTLEPPRLAAMVKQLAEKRKAVGGREIRGELLPAPTGDSLMLIAPPTFVEQWESIIASADQREQIEKKTYSTGSFGSREVATLIEQTVRTGGGGGSASAGTTGPAAGDDRWRIVFDDLTGTLIITATPAQHEQIEALLGRLASVPAGARRPVRMFQIRNRGVKEVQQVIEDLMRAGVLDAQASGGTDSSASPGLITNPVTQTILRPNSAGGTPVDVPSSSSAASTWPLAPGNAGAGKAARSAGPNAPVTLTADEATNTLIAVGEPRLLAQLEQFLPTLDVNQPQVMLETFLVSLTDTQAVNLGVELQKLHISGGTLFQLSSLFGLSTASGSGATATRTVGDSAGFGGW